MRERDVSHIIYTYDGFANTLHCDDDGNLRATGVWGPCRKSGELMSRDDRFVQTGHAIYVALYKILVDLDKIDSIAEMA